MSHPAEQPDVSTYKPAGSHAAATGSSKAVPIAIGAVLIAAVALGLSIWDVVRKPAPAAQAQTATATSSLSPADAKTRTCTAYNTVSRAVSLQTNTQPADDPTSRAAVAANARLATLGGGQYLLAALDPATPKDIAETARSFANSLTEIGMSQLAGAPGDDPEQAGRLKSAQESSVKLGELCK